MVDATVLFAKIAHP